MPPKEGDMVKANTKYADIKERFGDTPHKVVAAGSIPSCKQLMVWLDCGGGGFLADGFDVVEPS